MMIRFALAFIVLTGPAMAQAQAQDQALDQAQGLQQPTASSGVNPVAPPQIQLQSPAPFTGAPDLVAPALDAVPVAPVQAPVQAPAAAPGTETSPSSISAETPIAPETTTEVTDSVDEVASFSLPKAADIPLLAQSAWNTARAFMVEGGPSIWAIGALSVVTLALILWKIWRLALLGAWSRGKAGKAVAAFERGEYDLALQTVRGRMGIRSRVVCASLLALRSLPEERAREETTRIAKREIANASGGLRALELIATIAPLLGLLGTVLGMIAAFQALQEAGSRADPSLLAGGIWEALLTTAAGMAVAIPASAALTWFEAVIDRIRRDIEDGVTSLFIAHQPERLELAAE